MARQRADVLGLANRVVTQILEGLDVGDKAILLGAEPVPGAVLVMRETGFDAALGRADLVLTAEGSVDASARWNHPRASSQWPPRNQKRARSMSSVLRSTGSCASAQPSAVRNSSCTRPSAAIALP